MSGPAVSGRRDSLWLIVTLATIIAVIAIVSVSPYVLNAHPPRTPASWLSLLVPVATVIVGAMAVVAFSRRSRAQRSDLLAANERLRLATESGIEGAEQLRMSVATGAANERKLRRAEALGVAGAERLRIAVAQGVDSADALRVSVADGLDGAEALRVSVANGLDAASAALAVVDSVDAGITLYDIDGAILLTNATARALALSGETVAGVLNEPFVFGADRKTPIRTADQIVARASRGELVTRGAYWVGIGARQRAMMATSQYVRRASGELIGTVVATHDVTPLAEAIETRDEFLTTVSHELLTPMTSVIGYLEVIEDLIDVEAAGIATEFAIVQRNVRRLNGLIRDLLTTAEDGASHERRITDVAELATSSMNAVRARASLAGIHLICGDLEHATAEVDAERISDVLDKLLTNAIAYNRPGGHVSVSVVRAADDILITVTDTGIGISEGDAEHIFERFYRAHTSRERQIAGAGLGLTTARAIANAHHGSITARSTLGVGTAMEFRLPSRVSMAA